MDGSRFLGEVVVRGEVNLSTSDSCCLFLNILVEKERGDHCGHIKKMRYVPLEVFFDAICLDSGRMVRKSFQIRLWEFVGFSIVLINNANFGEGSLSDRSFLRPAPANFSRTFQFVTKELLTATLRKPCRSFYPIAYRIETSAATAKRLIGKLGITVPFVRVSSFSCRRDKKGLLRVAGPCRAN